MPIVETTAGNFWMDGYLKDALDYFKKDVLKKNSDCFLVVDGKEGGGKSTKANQIANYLDPNFSLKKTIFTADEFFEAVKNGKKGDCIVFDEAFGYLASRRAMSKFNVTLVKIMAEMRFKNMFVILCIPSFFELDKYPALHRSRALIHIYNSRDGNRGYFLFYNHETKTKLYLNGKKGYNYKAASPNFHSKFTKFFSLDQEEYDKKKHAAVFNMDQRKTGTPERDNKLANALLYLLHENYGKKWKEVKQDLENVHVNLDISSLSHRKLGFEAKLTPVNNKQGVGGGNETESP